LKKSKLPPAGEVFAACGASAFYPRDAFLAAGGFDESYFCFIEDVDLGFRLRLAGEKCQFDPSCRVIHAGGAITGKLSSFSAFHSIRNTVWTVIKNMPCPLLLITGPLWLLATVILIVKASPQRRKALLAGLRAAFTHIAGPLKARKTIQRQRKIGWLAVAEMVSWNFAAMKAHLPIVYPFAVRSANDSASV
jgi:GT2 family glycosyltransferase